MAKNMTDKKKNASRSQGAELKSQELKTEEKVLASKSVKAPSREERRAPAKQESKPAPRRDTRGSASPSTFARLRNSQLGRFLIEAYYELRHKVTWPTFPEARNMTVAVILISVVVGGLLSLLDLGLFQLFLLITGR